MRTVLTIHDTSATNEQDARAALAWALSVLRPCLELAPAGLTYSPDAGTLTDEDTGAALNASVYSSGMFRREVEARGLGGGVNRGKWRGFDFDIAATLCRHYLGNDPGALYHGRGTAFRARVAALRKLAEAKKEEDRGDTEPCERCGRPVPAGNLHPCPYQEEINDDYEDCCNCCDECAQECASDV